MEDESGPGRHRRALARTGILVLPCLGLFYGLATILLDVRPKDANYFWTAGHSESYYGAVWGTDTGSFFVYPPPLAQAVGVLPWDLYILGWMTLLGLGWWAATREWALPVLVFTVVAFSVEVAGYSNELWNPIALTGLGNPQILVAAAMVVGFRYPALWAFVLLTKIAPGIGLLWFAVRREWRNLGIALGTTAVVLVVSFALAPGAWAEFVQFAQSNAVTESPEPVVPIPFAVRAAMSAALIAWGARTNRAWTVPIGAGWAAIALYEWSFLTVWLAALPLARRWQPGRPIRTAEVMTPLPEPQDFRASRGQ